MTTGSYVDCEEKIMPGEGDEAPRDKKRRMIELFRDSAYAHVRSLQLLESVVDDMKKAGLLYETNESWFVRSHVLGVIFIIPIKEILDRFHNSFSKHLEHFRGGLPCISVKKCSSNSVEVPVCLQFPLSPQMEVSLDTIATLLLAVGAEREIEHWFHAWNVTVEEAPPALRLRTALIAVHGFHMSPISELIRRSLPPDAILNIKDGTITVLGTGSTRWRISLDPVTNRYCVHFRPPRNKNWGKPAILEARGIDPVELAQQLAQAPNGMGRRYSISSTLLCTHDYDWHLVDCIARRHAPLRMKLLERELRDQDHFDESE
jgi:hypothetical protein